MLRRLPFEASRLQCASLGNCISKTTSRLSAECCVSNGIRIPIYRIERHTVVDDVLSNHDLNSYPLLCEHRGLAHVHAIVHTVGVESVDGVPVVVG